MPITLLTIDVKLNLRSLRTYVQQCSVPEQSTILGMMIVLDLLFI